MIPVSHQTLQFLENEEGRSLKAYLDSRGIWTIGIGMTTLYGRPVKPSDVITQAQEDQLFGAKAQYCQSHMLALLNPPIVASLNENQITALTSLAYNIGLGGGKDPGFAESEVRRDLNAGNFQLAADAFLHWSRVGNDKTALLERRKRERSLFLS